MTMQLIGVENDFVCQGKTYKAELTRGLSYLYDAIALWNIVSSPKGAQLSDLIQWQHETLEGQEGLRVLGQAEIAQIVDLLSGIEQDLSSVMDEQEVVRPEALSLFQKNAPELLSTRPTETGTVYTLANVLMTIINARHFFEGALCEHCDVEIEY
jgi:hypothetical protein